MAIDRSKQNWPSNTAYTIDNAVVRNDTGNLVVRQCHPKIHTEVKQTRQKQEFNGNTVVDILNRLQLRKSLYKIVMDKR